MEKFYLDTNILFGYFLKKILERKGIYKESKVANFLISSSKRLKYAVSILTKAEVARMLKSNFGIDESVIREMWNGFLFDVSHIILQFTNRLKKSTKKSLASFQKYP